jgi:hypothetical protein
LTAHGTDPDAVDEERFTDICIMYADGLIGNRGLIETLGGLKGALYNYMRPENQRAYTLQDMIPMAYEYLFPPLSEKDKTEKVNKNLMQFMQMAPDAPTNLFEE